MLVERLAAFKSECGVLTPVGPRHCGCKLSGLSPLSVVVVGWGANLDRRSTSRLGSFWEGRRGTFGRGGPPSDVRPWVAMPYCNYYKVFACPLADECSLQSFDRAKVWGYTKDPHRMR